MADGRSRLSGHQYKKRRLEKDAERQKQAGALEAFLKKSELNKPSSSIREPDVVAAAPPKLHEDDTPEPDPNIIFEPGSSTSGSSAVAGELNKPSSPIREPDEEDTPDTSDPNIICEPDGASTSGSSTAAGEGDIATTSVSVGIRINVFFRCRSSHVAR